MHPTDPTLRVMRLAPLPILDYKPFSLLKSLVLPEVKKPWKNPCYNGDGLQTTFSIGGYDAQAHMVRRNKNFPTLHP